MEAIYKLLREVKDLPPAPQVLPKVLQALEDEQTTLEEVGELIALEPVLTARLLHYCNSAYFRGAEPVSNVPEAIGRVGFQTIFAIVAAASGKTLFKMAPDSGVDVAVLWKHSIVTAFSCKFIAEDLELDANTLFTAGLLHDLGRVALAKSKGSAYGKLLNDETSLETAVQREKAAYGFHHADVGACLLENWRLPGSLVQSVRYHHQPAAAGPHKKLAASVCAGNALAHLFEHPAEGLNLSDPELQNAMTILGIAKQNMESFDEQLQENWNFVNALIEMH
ncbi:MAG TPA: HDOD domain-containing protein [Verrucomicrobiae bacterium]